MNIKKMQKMCGTYATAKHLKALGYPVEYAAYLLARKEG
jgi:hypothetical protein